MWKKVALVALPLCANAQVMIRETIPPPAFDPEAEVVLYGGTTLRLPFDEIAAAAGKHGVFDVYVEPLDAAGSSLAAPALVGDDAEIYTDQGASQLAFPTAMGFGRNAAGGRDNPSVCIVTALSNGGAGSFRDCADNTGSRIIVFDIAGTIGLTSAVEINGNARIDCQSAPGDGVQFTGDTVEIAGSDVAMRFCKLRPDSDDSAGAALAIVGTGPFSDIIIDHVDVMFDSDENFEVWGDEHTNITVQYMANSWGLDCAGAAEGVLTGCGHGDGRHSKAMLSGTASGDDAPTNISILFSAFGNSIDRLPYLYKAGDLDFRYNVSFNHGAFTGANSSWAVFVPENRIIRVNMIGNMFRRDPNNSTNDFIRGNSSTFDDGSLMFASGNCDGDDDSTVTPDLLGDWDTASEFDYPDDEIIPIACEEDALINALDGFVGAIYPSIDVLTDRFHDDMMLRTAGDFTVNTASEVEGGLPDLTTSGTSHGAGYDDDSDGMPDVWENHASGNNGSILPGTKRANGWNNLENFLNDLAKDGVANGDYVWEEWTYGNSAFAYRVSICNNGDSPAGSCSTFQDFEVVAE